MRENFNPASTFSSIVMAGNGIGLLEHHADVLAGLGRPQAAAVDIGAIELDTCRRAAHRAPSSCIRLRMRRKVDLPQPDGPISAVTWQRSIVRVTDSRPGGR